MMWGFAQMMSTRYRGPQALWGAPGGIPPAGVRGGQPRYARICRKALCGPVALGFQRPGPHVRQACIGAADGKAQPMARRSRYASKASMKGGEGQWSFRRDVTGHLMCT